MMGWRRAVHLTSAVAVWTLLVLWPHEPAGARALGPGEDYKGGGPDRAFGVPFEWGIDISCLARSNLLGVDRWQGIPLLIDGMVWAALLLVAYFGARRFRPSPPIRAATPAGRSPAG